MYMNKFFRKNNKNITFFLINVLIGFGIISLLHFFNVIDINFFLRFRHFALIVFILFSLILFLFFEKEKELKRNVEKYFKISFFLGVVLLILGYLEVSVLERFSFHITTITVFFAIFLLYFNNEKVEKKISEEIESEKKASNWPYILGVILVLIYSALLIYPNLGSFDFYHDENWHVQVLDSLEKGDGFYLRDYIFDEPTRRYYSGELTNLGSHFFSSFFSDEIFGRRFFVATISLANLVVIYAIFKSYLPKSISLLITFFVSYNIIFLYLARFLRSYPLFLLSYLLTMLCTIKLIKHFKEKNLKGIILNFSLIVLFTLIAISEREIAKILFVNLGIIFFFLFWEYREFALKSINKHKKVLLNLIPFFIATVLILEVLGITKINLIPMQIFQQFSLGSFRNPTNIYYSYLFKDYAKIISLNLILVFSGIGYLFFNIKNDLKKIVFLTFLIVPIFFNIYLLDRYEDFRYVYHIVPFASAISLLGLYVLLSVFIKQKSIKIALSFIILIVMLSYPMIPFSENSGRIFTKSITEWSEDDGQKYLHRRAVPPEYSKVFNYLKANKSEGDIVIVNEAPWKIDARDNIEYYHFESIWDDSDLLINSRDYSEINFFELIAQSEGKVWYLGAYMHMMDYDVNEYFLKNCYNISEDLEIKKYNYDNYYQDRFYWPNLFLCE